QDLIDVGTIHSLSTQCAALISVCPPHAAEEVANQVIETGYKGLFIDANAISVEKAQRIGRAMNAAGIEFVDGGIIGGPAWEPNRTWLYLAGPQAESVVPLFAAGPLETEICGTQIGQASALKMMYAAYTKGTSALLALILAGAESLHVREVLQKQWDRYWPDFTSQTEERMRRVTAKAWRFEGEMHEIANTFESVGLPSGFHQSAAEIYRRMANFRDASELPELKEVLDSLC
ncbi:MAG: DUF1932 domain-containing protein, partial [Candidatus Promineifilaceae bacterium]|nr:DUF1932 domain-containing protein [Candidatus Promineifilaceae bacterium]